MSENQMTVKVKDGHIKVVISESKSPPLLGAKAASGAKNAPAEDVTVAESGASIEEFPGDADWNVSTKEVPEEFPDPAGAKAVGIPPKSEPRPLKDGIDAAGGNVAGESSPMKSFAKVGIVPDTYRTAAGRTMDKKARTRTIASAAVVGTALGALVIPAVAAWLRRRAQHRADAAADAARRAAAAATRSVEDDAPRGADATPAAVALWDCYARLRDLTLRADPGSASMLGDHRWAHALADLSRGAFDAQAAELRALQADLARAVPSAAALPAAERPNHAFLSEMLALALKRLASWQCFETPSNQLFGPHLELVPIATQFSPADTPAEKRDLLARLAAFDAQADQMIAAFRAGVAARRTHPPSAIDAMVAQCDAQLGGAVADHPIVAALAKRGDGGADARAFAAAAARVVRARVRPAYARLRAFLADEYRPHARATAGICGWDGGATMYQAALEYFTSLPGVTADEVHATGLREVARIRDEMASLVRAHGAAMLSADAARAAGGGDARALELGAFMRALKADAAQAPADGEAIARKYREILEVAERVSREGHRGRALFGRLPKAGYEVKPVEPFREQHAPPAFYYPPAADGSRGGVFYANTYKPETRGMFVMESIALHEAIPGHHFQIAIAQELDGLPWLRKQVQDFCTAYIEGWGLYTEKLGIEMGFYTDPCQDFGRLTTEMMRAVRLVIDTGLHAKFWTRERAIEYFQENSAMGEADVQAEVDRYMVFPGQACSYKMGELKILELRRDCEARLGAKFRLDAFHDMLLGSGALPLKALEDAVSEWVRVQSRTASV